MNPRASIVALLFAVLTAAVALCASVAQARTPNIESWKGCGVPDKCHGKQYALYKDSVHGANGVTCDECHGGDASVSVTGEEGDTTWEQAAIRAMRTPGNRVISPKPRTHKEKLRVVKMCAKCHSWRHGSKSNPFEEYKLSTHGRKLFKENNKDVAVCTNCHGGIPTDGIGEDGLKIRFRSAHQIRPVSDPKSSAHPANVPETCGQCHDSEKIAARQMARERVMTAQEARQYVVLSAEQKRQLEAMTPEQAKRFQAERAAVLKEFLKTQAERKKHFPEQTPQACRKCHYPEELVSVAANGRTTPKKPPATKFHEYAASIHGESVIGRGDVAAPTCATCHSGHAASPPGYADITRVCGKCHISEAKQFKKSHHAAAMERKHISMCISCHGNHKHSIPPAGGEALLRTGCKALACHGERDGLKPLPPGATLQQLTRRARTRVERGEARLKRAAANGVDVEKLTARLGEARQMLIQANGALENRQQVDRVNALCDGLYDGLTAFRVNIGTTLHDRIAEARRRVDEAETRIDRARRHGAETEEMESLLAEAKASLTEARPVLHSLRIKEVETYTLKAGQLCDEIESEINAIHTREQERKLLYWPLLCFTILVSCLIALKIRQFKKQRALNEKV